jgi:hypothetical protein
VDSAKAGPRTGHARLAAALATALRSAGYAAERIEAELGTHELTARPVDLSAHRRRLAGDGSAFAVLARLLLLGDPVDAAVVDRVAAPVGASGLTELGLCEASGAEVRARVRLVPHGDYFVCSDAEAPVGMQTPFAYVPGVQAPSVTLAKLAVRRPVERALDLGTGSGLQALLAAKHADVVVATDVNVRALGFAAFNAQLNGLANIEFRHGSSFEPVEGDRFDLIVSNPPYVISPDHRYAYRDSELAGDELCRRIVGQAPAYLREGGFAHVLVSWTHDPEGAWEAPLREWVEGSGCDVWLLHYRTSDPLAHALGWLRPLADDDPAEFETAVDRWLAYLAERQVGAVGYGAVVLRRRSGGRNWVRAEQLPLERLEPASEHTLRVFAGNDLLNRLEDEPALLDARLRLTERHRLGQTLACREGRVTVEEATLELTDGLRFSVGLDRYTTLLLPHLDGARTLAEALAATAAGLELNEHQQAEFATAALPPVRRLVELGFLEPESAPA